MLSKTDKQIMIYLEQYHAITIKQAQRHFYKSQYGYDVAKKRLKQLENVELIKSYKNPITSEKVYYTDRKVSAHDLYIFDFYSILIEYGCINIEFIKNPKYLKGVIVPDSFFKFEYEGSLYFILLEVDLTHTTSMGKFQLYEKLYRDGELKEKCYGTFPIIVVMSFEACLKYESENFEVVYLPFELTNFESKVLGSA
ncbi:hypothetical protein [Clostridium omnivorum]|uniref:Replication-relaxation n=1 Tax=Clostridium omnivorum TaxID=1604902 RepID=A0ABQ5NC84_9CLOT|nr:hypothetical protein [Clostridium sp. E14]GLC32879.1 hypothetical protein bsdE14_42890 [Clostridium sp. E14]